MDERIARTTLMNQGPLDIIHLAVSMDTREGGMPRAVVGVANALGAAGGRNVVITVGRPAEALHIPGATEVFVPPGIAARWGLSVRIQVAFMRALRRGEVPIFHCVWSGIFFLGASLCLLARHPYVLMPHGSLAQADLAKHGRVKKTLAPILARPLVRRARVVLVTSSSEARAVKTFCPESKPAVAPLPLGAEYAASVDQRRPRDKSDPLRLLYAGRLDPRKGIDIVIAALAQLSEERRPRLCVLSDMEPGELRRLKRLATAAGVSGQIEWQPWAGPRDLSRIYRDVDCVCVLSSTENFALSAHESLAVGTPVLIADNLDLAEAVEHAGAGWSISRNVNAVAQTLSWLLKNPDELQRARAAARHWASQMPSTQSLGELYRDLLGVATA